MSNGKCFKNFHVQKEKIKEKEPDYKKIFLYKEKGKINPDYFSVLDYSMSEIEAFCDSRDDCKGCSLLIKVDGCNKPKCWYKLMMNMFEWANNHRLY